MQTDQKINDAIFSWIEKDQPEGILMQYQIMADAFGKEEALIRISVAYLLAYHHSVFYEEPFQDFIFLSFARALSKDEEDPLDYIDEENIDQWSDDFDEPLPESLKEMLNQKDPDELVDLAETFGVKKGRKGPERLAEDLCKKMMQPNVIREVMAVLNKPEQSFFHRLAAGAILEDDFDNPALSFFPAGAYLYRNDMGNFMMPKNVQQAYRSLEKDPDFLSDREKMSWVFECAYTFVNFYGFGKLPELKEMIDQKEGCSLTVEELRDILSRMHSYFPFFAIEGDKIYNTEVFKDGLEDRIAEAQKGFSIKYPSVDQIESYAAYGWLNDLLYYRLLDELLSDYAQYSFGNNDSALSEVFDQMSIDMTKEEWFDLLDENGVDMDYFSVKRRQVISILYKGLYETTPLVSAKGWSSAELKEHSNKTYHCAQLTKKEQKTYDRLADYLKNPSIHLEDLFLLADEMDQKA